MKRIYVENEFTQWAEYLARYFGDKLIIYDDEGVYMWGDTATTYKNPTYMQIDNHIKPIYRDLGIICAYLDTTNLTYSERLILETIIPFIESQLDDEGA